MPQPPQKPSDTASSVAIALVAVPCTISAVIGLFTLLLLSYNQPVLLLVLSGVLVWLPPVAVLRFGVRAASRYLPRYTLGMVVAAWIAAAWILLVVEAAAALILFGNALMPPDSSY